MLHPCLSSWTHSPRDGVLKQVFLSSHTVCEHCQENPGPHCHSWQALIVPYENQGEEGRKICEVLLQWRVREERILGFFVVVSDIGGLVVSWHQKLTFRSSCVEIHTVTRLPAFSRMCLSFLQSVFRPYLLAWFRIWGLHSVYGLIGYFWRFLFLFYLLISSDAETMNSCVRWLLCIYHGSYSFTFDYS